jgi:hypothetical protein
MRVLAGRSLLHHTLDAADAARLPSQIPSISLSKQSPPPQQQQQHGQNEPYQYQQQKNERPAIDVVMVCTDDDGIEQHARSHRMMAREASNHMVLRHPSSMADDDSPVLPVLQRALATFQRLHGHNMTVNAICLLRPTSPCRTSLDISNALLLYHQHVHAPLIPLPSLSSSSSSMASSRGSYSGDGWSIDSVVGVVHTSGLHPTRIKHIVPSLLHSHLQQSDHTNSDNNVNISPTSVPLLVDAFPTFTEVHSTQGTIVLIFEMSYTCLLCYV